MYTVQSYFFFSKGKPNSNFNWNCLEFLSTVDSEQTPHRWSILHLDVAPYKDPWDPVTAEMGCVFMIYGIKSVRSLKRYQ